jgi:hypothetical protein
MDMLDVKQDFGFCAKRAPVALPQAGVCKDQEDILSMEKLQKDRNKCPIQMICPSILPPLDFIGCRVRYACGRTGVHWLKPGLHGSTHGGDFKVTSNSKLFNVDGNLEEYENPPQEDVDGAQDTDEVRNQDQIEEDDSLEAIDEEIPNRG